MTVEPTLDEIRKRLGKIPLFSVFMWATDRYDAQELWTSEIMREHLAWQLRLEDEGKLFAAGPFDHDIDRNNRGPREPLGMYIFAAKDREEAEAIAATEPFAREGYRTYQVRTFMLNEGVGRGDAASLMKRISQPTSSTA
jgi:uncharacterized protein YciI